ncbi:GlcG/HbpS family heme-binding protein [Tengunoibacter tsumagoiensis]|uniref:Heme-binding protein n=1 Tax=Tengunoibacter tsumagoiensis TaxID=2014871 RepID=A0A401ZTS1_9CHLR|nr:heme-binding protein [Tengunoibacter tsumagoiensis]GCE10263.1 hypothetical protein KTT_01220 [Tengunoibacter tsumagoiensis]
MSISIDLARKVLEACKRRAGELRSPVSIAIVDAGGHLVLFERMMAPHGFATGNISIAKATTAVMFNQSTDAIAQWGGAIPGFASSLSAMTEGKFIMAAGGWPLRYNGVTIGGIGVSGGNAPGRDDEIAQAGLFVLDAGRRQASRSPAPTPASAQPDPAFYSAVPPAMAGERMAQAQEIPNIQQLSAGEDDPYSALRFNSSNTTHEDHPGDRYE